ncbi:DUF6443 domain-containing protein [Hymenobacter yonginensis]|uniref:DUF6443 domain-containing protein n=1 Tax=Hymenobacter yonginensis TaxID=748197 RepID=A0ABY7PMP8_9BACT|nr:DUF6443 domain-containing protein [Hymenobacter yonginensis]WBO84486.1 DUF6443 domain-containing protein [Hymenobacter yonginensis]
MWLYSKTVYAKAKVPCAPLTLTASPNVSIPTGDAVVLRAYPGQDGAILQWSPATGLSTTTGAVVTAAPTVTTTYTVTATTTGACPATTQATVRVTVTPPLALSNPPVDGCVPTLINTPPTPRPPGAADAVNYVRTYTARAAYTNPARLRAAVVDSVQVKTEYLDGLGRPVQTVLRQESPDRHDLVQPIVYDELGRQHRQYLPYVASAAPDPVGYYPRALTEQYAFYRETPIGPGFATDRIARTGVPFSETVFEASPLNRVIEQAAPGETWRLGADHTVTQEQRPNTAADGIPRYEPGYDIPTALTYQGAYPAGELWVTESRDERGFRTQEFKDKQGQVVAKRVECPPPTQNTPGQATPTWLTTLYVYDDFGRLRTVVPPKAFVRLPAANWEVTGTVENLLFRYRYDERGRVVGKNVPGQTGETQLVYDQLDRPVMSQDPEQRRRREWAWTKYDALGRVVMTGLTIRNVSQVTAQTEANNWLTPGTAQYTAQNRLYEQRTANATYSMRITSQQAYPPMSTRGYSAGPILTATYYDDYDYDQNGQPDVAFDTQYNAQFASGQAPVADLRTTGMPTRTKTRVLGVPATDPNAWLTVTTFYDEKARPVQVRSTNARGGEDVVTTQLDFAGKVIKSYATHTVPSLSVALAVAENFTYDHAGRLKKAQQQLPGEAQPALIAEPRYNELGQLVTKTLAPGTPLEQRVDFAYNIRGWLTHINDPALSDPSDLWGMQLSYDCGFQVPQYTGNIAGQKWRSKSDGIERAYGYLYDGASRLLSGDFVARNAATQAWTAERQRYGLSGMRYDENGNILGLQRRGLLAQATRTAPAQFGATDNLSYTYTGNRLTRVDDAVTTNALPRPAGYNGAPTSLAGDFQEEGVRQAGEYRYDDNGNLTSDANKRITAIVYNHLNLPRRIVFGTGADSIVFRYTAAGQKVLKRVYQTGKPLVQTDYLGAYQYEADSLRFFPHAEGRVLRRVQFDAAGQPIVSYRREYSLKDHLGNLRVAYKLGDPARFRATMELADSAREERQFEYVRQTRHATAVARSGQHVARLNAATGQPLGPLKIVSVQKGDTVTFTAPGLYQQTVRNISFGFSLPGFVASLLLQPAPAPVVGPDGRPKPRALPFLGVGLGLVPALNQSGRIPKGYARLLVYNQDSVLVDSYTQQLSAAALNNYEQLRLRVIAPSAGYVTAYVGNESDVDVFFDEVQLDYGPALLVQENQYDPFGLNLAGIEKQGQPNHQFQYNGKEKQEELGLNWTDYGARMYDAQLGRWHAVDPMAEKYPDISPYAYVANNPVNFVDPDGKQIDPGSQKDWDKQKQATIDRRDKLQNKIDKLTEKAEEKGWSADKLAGKMGNLGDRVSSLNGSIANLGVLEKSTQVYSLRTGAAELGGNSYDSKTGNIVISFKTTANFIHEITHAGQYEASNIAFSSSGATLGQDVSDEVAAYKAQFAYDPSSVSGLSSTVVANSFAAITSSWVQGIRLSNGSLPYAPGGSSNTGLVPVNINSTRDILIQAYPHAAESFKGLPANYTLKSIPGIRYKK